MISENTRFSFHCYSDPEGSEKRAREAARTDGISVRYGWRRDQFDTFKYSMLEERLEQVREIDGELAYGKMRRALEKASQEKASQEKARQARQVERARQVESARLERAMQETARQSRGRRGPERGGGGEGLWPQPLSGSDGQHFPCVRYRKPRDLRSRGRIDQALLGSRGRYMPDLHFVAFGQCFPRYRYRERAEVQRELPGIESGRERIDNISDTALRAFRVRYNDNTITKDAIFDYVYGVLHASAYRERFANDLAKELPRIPLAPDFHAFAKAGRELAELHLGYETCEEYSLEVAFAHSGDPRPSHFRIGDRAMRFADDEKTVLAVNEHVSLRGIPDLAHTYQVNGRTPLEWFIDRYRITQDKESGIVNDPNGWFDDPRELVAAIRRIVHVSVETARIVTGKPVTMRADFPAGGRAL